MDRGLLTWSLGPVLLDAQVIAARIAEMAAAISGDYAGLDSDLVLVPVLKGSVAFATDLSRQITVPVIFDYVRVRSYGTETESSGNVQLLQDLSLNIRGRHVLMVEDIIDTGLTTTFLFEHLQRHQPASLKLCALLNKPERRLREVPVHYKGFDIPNAFVVGYGLDFNERFRNLTAVHVLQPGPPGTAASSGP
jgi:hypoxanthine phosphoribosyltransferase